MTKVYAGTDGLESETGENHAAKPIPIAAVERDTGLSKDTLRIWERRYGFPQPVRGALAERSYPQEQVQKLMLVKRLMDGGMRPGRVLSLPMEELRGLAGEASSGAARVGAAAPGTWDRWMQGLHAHDAAGLNRMLRQSLLQLGLLRFVTDLVAPLSEAVGEGWMSGRLRIFEEHLFTESIQTVLRNAIAGLTEPDPATAPRVLLATLPQEYHGLGLLMAEAVLAAQGCCCVSLGVRVPMDEIVAAAQAYRADIVGLSFSASFNAAQALSGLRQLRGRLPARVEIWAGGRCAALQRRSLTGVLAANEVATIPVEVARWRHAAAGR